MLQHITANVENAKFKCFPLLAEYMHNAQPLTDTIKQMFTCTDEQVKQLILMRLNGGIVGTWSNKCKLKGSLPPSTLKFFDELKLARELVVQSRPDLLRAATDAGSTRPELTAFSYILCEQEDKALQIIESVARELCIRVECLCFDGLVLDFGDCDINDEEAKDNEFHKRVEQRIY